MNKIAGREEGRDVAYVFRLRTGLEDGQYQAYCSTRNRLGAVVGQPVS
jgi:hypothetical protein